MCVSLLVEEENIKKIEQYNEELRKVVEEIERKKNECRALTQSMEEGNFDAFMLRTAAYQA